MEGGEVAGLGLVPYTIVCQSKGCLEHVSHAPDNNYEQEVASIGLVHGFARYSLLTG